MKIKTIKVHKNAVLPKLAHPSDAGWDLYSVEDVILKKGIVTLVKTGLSMEIPDGYEVQIRPRSGLALKRGVFMVNAPGTIDAGYRGEVGLILSVIGEDQFFPSGTRLGQAVIASLAEGEFIWADHLSDSDRSTGGYGSSGE